MITKDPRINGIDPSPQLDVGNVDRRLQHFLEPTVCSNEHGLKIALGALSVVIVFMGQIIPLSFPPEFRARLWMIADFISRITVIQPTIEHHIPNLFRVPDVFKRVCFQDNKIGELAGFE